MAVLNSLVSFPLVGYLQGWCLRETLMSAHSREHSYTGVVLHLSYTNATWNVVAKIYRILEVVFRVGGTVQATKSKLLCGFLFSYS